MGVTRGTYVVATSGGVGTTAVDARVDQAGLFTPNGDLAAVPGVLSGCAVTGIASGWAYNVAAGHVVTSRSATDGAVLMAVNGVTSTPAPVLADGVTAGSTSAPVSGSRWEIIWIRQRDLDNADADNNAVLGVTQGAASGSPTKPAIPAGALALAESLVLSGAANTASGSVTITNVAARVGLRGGIVAVANSTQRDILNSFATAMNPIYIDDSGILRRSVGSGFFPMRLGAVSAQTTTVMGPGFTSETPIVTTASIVCDGVTRHKITATPACLTATQYEFWEFRIKRDSTVIRRHLWVAPSNALTSIPSFTITDVPSAGSHTYSLSLVRTGGTNLATLTASASDPAEIIVEAIA